MRFYVCLFLVLILIAPSCNCDDEIMEEIEEEIKCNCLDLCASNYNAEAEGYDDCFYADKFIPKNYSRFFNSKKGVLKDLQMSVYGEFDFFEIERIEDGCSKKVVYQLTVTTDNNVRILDTELTTSGPYLHTPNNYMKFDSVYFKDLDFPFNAECYGYWEHELCDAAFNWTANCECTVTGFPDGTSIKDSIEFNLFQ